MTAQVEHDRNNHLRMLAEESAKELMIKGGASHLAIKASSRTPVKYFLTNPHRYPMYLKEAPKLLSGAPKGFQAMVTRTMTSRLGTFLAKRQLTAVAAMPITLPLNAVMAFGFVARAARASEMLKALNPDSWKRCAPATWFCWLF